MSSNLSKSQKAAVRSFRDIAGTDDATARRWLEVPAQPASLPRTWGQAALLTCTACWQELEWHVEAAVDEWGPAPARLARVLASTRLSPRRAGTSPRAASRPLRRPCPLRRQARTPRQAARPPRTLAP